MMYKRICSLVIIISMLSVPFCTAPSYAAEVKLTDPITSNSSKNYSNMDQVSVVTSGSNSYLKFERSLESNSRCRLTKNSDYGLDGSVAIISYDFMFGSDPSGMEVEIATLQNNANNYASRSDFKNGVLYDTKASSNDKVAIRSDFVKDKWYNTFTVVDTTEKEYQVYSANNESAVRDYLDSGSPEWVIDRWISFENWTKGSILYVDNVELVKVKYVDAEVALRQARGVMLEAEYGYENGKIPTANKNLLATACSVAEEMLVSDSLTSSEAENCENDVKTAMTLFLNSKLDFNAEPGIPSYIISDIDKAIPVDSVNGAEYPLTAQVMDTTNSEIADSEITWELVGDYSDISISNGTLIAQGGAEGEVVVKASIDSGLYNLFTLQLAEAKKVETLKFTGKDGSIEIEGAMDESPLEKVKIYVAGQGEGIDFSGELTVNADNSFKWNKTFDNTTAFQDVTVIIKGDDVVRFEKVYPYYGKGWMQKIPLLFNNAKSADEVGDLLEKYSEGIALDTEDYKVYTQDYKNEVYKDRASYESIGDIKKKLEDVYLINHPNGRPDDITERKAASSVVFGEDFEDYALEDGVVKTVDKNYGVANGVRVYGDINNKYATMKKDSTNDARLAHDFVHQENKVELPADHPKNEISKYGLDTGMVSVSLDYMMQSDPLRYDVELLAILMDVANKPAAYIDLKDGTLYDGQYGKGTTSALKNNLVKNKWYHIMVLVDCDNRNYCVYTGDAMTERHEFVNTSETAIIDRFFSMRTRSQNTPFNFDNVKVAKVNYPELEIALHKALALIMEAEGSVGYEDGQYPESTYNLLKDCYSKVQAENKNANITEAEAVAYATELLEKVDIFANSRIDKNDAPGTAAFIESDVPAAIGIGNSEYIYTLNAKIMDTTNNEMAGTVYWQIMDDDFYNAELWGNRLVVQPNTRGEVTLKAYTESGLYNLYKITFTDIKMLSFVEYAAKGGKITVCGNFDKLPLEKVRISVLGDDAHDAVEASGIATVNSDYSFKWEEDVDRALPYQMMTIKIEGSDIKSYTDSTVPYYGIGWEEAVRAVFNGASSQENAKSLIGIYYVGIGADKAAFEKDSDIYAKAVYNGGKDYNSVKALQETVADTRCVLDFSYATRKTIEQVMKDNLATLTRNGFKNNRYASLSKTLLTGFLASAANINIDKATDSVSKVATLLNNLIPDSSTNSGNVEGGSLGGGGGSGGGGYKVSLVTPDNTKTENGSSEGSDKVTEFADASLAPWAKDALIFVRKEGIMEGDGTNVRPADAVTRGELAKILVSAFKLSANENSVSFEDGNGAWWQEFARTVAETGIMVGIGSNNFGGQSFVTREMMAVAIDRAINHTNVEFYDKNEGVSFNDSADIAPYARESIERLARKGIISGMGNGMFAPTLYVTRAEAAQMIYNVLSN